MARRIGNVYSLMNVGAFVLGLNMMASPKKGLVQFFFLVITTLAYAACAIDGFYDGTLIDISYLKYHTRSLLVMHLTKGVKCDRADK